MNDRRDIFHSAVEGVNGRLEFLRNLLGHSNLIVHSVIDFRH
jgi:hypothetical protein